MAEITVDFIAPDTLRLTLERDGVVLDTLDQQMVHPVRGPAYPLNAGGRPGRPTSNGTDDILLTGVDKLLQKNKIDQSALGAIRTGPGIDKNSSLYRIVTSFASAVEAARKG